LSLAFTSVLLSRSSLAKLKGLLSTAQCSGVLP